MKIYLINHGAFSCWPQGRPPWLHPAFDRLPSHSSWGFSARVFSTSTTVGTATTTGRGRGAKEAKTHQPVTGVSLVHTLVQRPGCIRGQCAWGFCLPHCPFTGLLHCTHSGLPSSAGKGGFCRPEGEQELGRGREAAGMEVLRWDSPPEP